MAEADICMICLGSLHDGRDLLTTSCKHMFHVKCISENATKNNNKCPICRQSVQSFGNIFTGYSDELVKSKKTPLSNQDDEYSWECLVCTFKNCINDAVCVMCEQGVRPQSVKIKASDDTRKPFEEKLRITPKCISSFCNTQDPSSNTLCEECLRSKVSSLSIPEVRNNSPLTLRDYSSNPPYILDLTRMDTEETELHPTEWCCGICSYPNNLSDYERCVYCQEGRRPFLASSPSPELRKESIICTNNNPYARPDAPKSQLPYPENDRYPSAVAKQKPQTTKPIITHVYRPTETTIVDNENSASSIVYIPDLPGDKTKTELEQAIRSRLKTVHHIEVSKVECFSDLGVGIVHLENNKEKDYLVNNLQRLILFLNDNITVTCAEQFEVTCYIVLEIRKPLPSIDKISERWITLFPSPHRPQFQTLSIQFPNIIQVISFSIEELQSVAKFKVFSIEDHIAHIYTHVDCSYLEELPRTQPKLDDNRLFCYIASQLNMSDRARTDKDMCQEQANTLLQQTQSLPSNIKSLKPQLYIQYNAESSNAIILASNSLQNWLSVRFININGQLIFKVANIASKFIIKSIPFDFPLQLIFNHPIFKKSINEDVAKLIGEHLVVEVNDKRIYEECLKIGAFEVRSNGDRLTLRIIPHTTLENPDDSEITIENWYGTRMEKHNPDIAQFDSRHPIFRYKWNSKIWLDRFMQNKREFEQITDQNERRPNDFIRRMLRVTAMLNTMGALRNGKYTLEDSTTKTEVFIKPPSPLVTVLYNSQSKIISSSKLNQTATPSFNSTNVRVLNEDCLISYNTLASSGIKPLLLNMANATTPGGGYRKGDGAQEENLFRRSNYYMSLDYNLDPEQDQSSNNKRSYCSSTGQVIPMNTQESLYPIDDYGAIYTSGITVLRGTEDQGYPYLQRPLYDVCAIAIAAYRGPPVQKNKLRLTTKHDVRTRKKIETLFAIAFKNGHDSLVLSALGCGAFRNPPEHIALIFKSVILQYAGFFKEIVFSVIDDHNTGQRLNPNGNFIPFQQVLDNFVARPPSVQSIGMSIGPYRLIRSKANNNIATIDEFIIGNVQPCEQAAYCDKLNDENHCQEFSHPSLCPLGAECTENTDDVHCRMFIHRQKCRDGGQCLTSNARHLADFDHPEYCPDGGHCTNIRIDHLNLYRHVPLCKNGIDCDLKYTEKELHLANFRHCQRPCEFGGTCIRFNDQKHITDEQHPFNTPCPYTPFSCKIFAKFLQPSNEQSNLSNQNEMNEIKRHCYRYSHICPWGRLCNDRSEEHLSMVIHIARYMCPDANNSCTRMMQEDHLDSFSHLNIRDIRLLCRYAGSECRDRTRSDHIIKYRHNYTLDYLGVAQYFALNKQINFVQNQIKMTKMIRDYVQNTYNKEWETVSVPQNLLEWIGALQPIHRCSVAIFESILVHGHVMSRSHMERLKDATFVADTVDQHKRIRKLLASQAPSLQKDAREFIGALVRTEFNNGISDGIKQTTEGNNPESLQYLIHSKEQNLKLKLQKSDLDDIRLCASQVAQASIKLHSTKTGIGFKGDLEFGTNQQVFGILGPHTAQYYGDIVIIFKRDVMLHPDSNFTMQAATMYTEKTYQCRPWIKDPGSSEGHVKQFHSTKLHCSILDYDYVTALELMAITGLQKQTMQVDLASVIRRWGFKDGHQVIEAHLPQLIPLSYIEYIFIPKNVFDLLPLEAQKNARELFPHNLKVTTHEVDLTIDPTKFGKPDNSREEYESYVAEQILKFIKRQQEQNATLSNSRLLSSYGMTITVPASHFETCVTNSLTITQSYNNSKSNEGIYIYWKALRGDFMVTLTNEMIESKKIQHNLVYLTCYIASFATSVSGDLNYNERHSYISHRPPSSHETVLEGQHFKVGSNTFHKGCNADDYILYCLKLKPQTGQVSLMNAGVNGIYNRTILKCTFNRNELDLTSLDYIHVSAGRQSISIRNLVISHELIHEAHPQFDKQFVMHINNTDSTDTGNNNDGTFVSRIIKPIKQIIDRVFHGNGEQRIDDDDNQLQDNQPTKHLPPCKDSIYCLEQYSQEKSLTHNQQYSHPCRFSELCRDISSMPHCKQFTHEEHNVSKCHYDENCSKLNDPQHRYSYRHTGLSDYLRPCRDHRQCRNSSFERRKTFFHGEQINRPSSIQNSSKDASKSKNTLQPSYSQNLVQQHKSHSSQSNRTDKQTRFQARSHTTDSSYTSQQHRSFVWVPEDEECDDEDLVTSFYNDDAGKSKITNAGGYDQYGNPIGKTYDLGRDGAFKDFNILIAQFYADAQFNDAAMKIVIDALSVKGFQVKHVKAENECITELASNRYEIAWIISTSQIKNANFISALIKYHSSGGAIFLFADNRPFVCHASEFLRTKFGITVDGNYHGGKTMTYKENSHQQTGNFGQHFIFTGIENLFEGITICHPVYSTPASRTLFVPIATATDGNTSIAVYDPPATSAEGRVCLDCGFTKLYINWDSAGTARYIVNASCWLLGIEKRLKMKKNKNKK
ncbi:unnamed protein product [Adineta steineri]|uniref:RING-type domain-containing protein n=1 Tax=Adineta steineri TaxID=433720 RepID=A0A818VC91_9BILA|nr:unnamed protein product [Adineta steineri]CAF3713045.1 unnamed protein product [Adineta steineri]